MKNPSAFPTGGALRLSASAGSGKTFSLTKLYLQKALKSPSAFRSVVAITFTNKAANELKDRIVKRLYELSSPQSAEKAYAEFGFSSADELSERAGKILLHIVHDFDSFKVLTIDSFFQLLFSQLSYDAGLPQGLEMELDQNRVKNEVLEAGLESMGAEIQEILLENVMNRLAEKGKGWRPVKYLQDNLLNSLFQSEVLDFQYPNSKEWLHDDRIVDARKVFEQYLEEENRVISGAAAQLVAACKSLSIDTNRFNRANYKDFNSELRDIEQLAQGRGDVAKRKASHAKGKFWRVAKEVSKEDIESISHLLIDLYEAQNPTRVGNIALAESILHNLSAIRLLIFFRSVLSSLNLETNRILLQEIKYILRSIISGNDVPYLYERIGNQLHALLIDEFQDTDNVQWAVLAPLAKAIVDNGGFFAMVGDVKQSIYGWRGGDSSLFKSGVDRSLYPHLVVDKPLETNYRSHGRIVYFNNWLFSRLSDQLATQVRQSELAVSDTMFNYWDQIYRNNYQDVSQLLKADYMENDVKGFVEVRVHKKIAVAQFSGTAEDEEDRSGSQGFRWIVQEIIRLQDAGIEASEIAILVRSNKDLAEMVQILDGARQDQSMNADFTFTAQSGETMNDHLVIQFLALGLQTAGYSSTFQFVQLEKLAQTLGLDPVFWQSEPGVILNWRSEFKSRFTDRIKTDLLGRLEVLYSFFGLAAFPQHQFAYVSFKNLILSYLQKESALYPDFGEWWNSKGSIQKLELPETSKGIQIMTIHKSKGLDFGVVILAINSNPTSDSLTQFDFWPKGEGYPWEAFPLLKSRASSAFLQSDLGQQYENQIYKQVLENLNLWYVAFTRPRYGLIVDICLGAKDNLELPTGNSGAKLARLAFQVPFQIKQSQSEWGEVLQDCVLNLGEDESEFILRFQYGTLERPIDQIVKDAETKVYIPGMISGFTGAIPWVKAISSQEEQLIGTLTHQVLEKCTVYTEWPGIFQTIKGQNLRKGIRPSIWGKIETNLETLFANDNIKYWFSDQYLHYSEQELVDGDGHLFRADRILVNKDEYILLDFKTGSSNSKHEDQLRNYVQTLSEIKGIETKAYLVYINPITIKEIFVPK